MSGIHIKKTWWAFLLLGMGLLLPNLSASVSADSLGANYTYHDSSYKQIIGADSSDNITYYNLTSGTQYQATDGTSNGIVTNSFGGTNGQFQTSGGRGGNSNSTPITISKSSATGTWLDHSHIIVNNNVYVDTHTSNADTAGSKGMCYLAEDTSGTPSSTSCPPSVPSGGSCGQQNNYINQFINPESNTANATATVLLHDFFQESPNAGNTTCGDHPTSVKLSNPNNAYGDYFIWQDMATITTSDGTSLIFKQSTSNAKQYVDDLTGTADQGNGGNSSCHSEINVSGSSATTGTLILRNNRNDNNSYNQLSIGNTDTWPTQINNAKFSPDGSGCWQSNPIQVPIGEPAQGKLAAGTFNKSGSGSTTSPSLSCTVTFNPLTWLLCPAVQGMVSIVNALDNVITSQLDVGNNSSCTASDQPCQIFGSTSIGSSGGYYTAWSSFRDIALGLMVVAGIIIVISQALGFEILDAYTVRKALPRLIIAAVGITLSWPLMQFFVTLTNDLGFGIRFLIYQPFTNIAHGQATLNGGGDVAANLVGGIAIVALGIFGLLSFAATAALAVFVAFLVLILRQLVIIVLIIVAPIAIVAYILPNTQNIFKLWWESFSRALLMFPLIAAFIAAGRVFAVVSSGNAATTGGVGGTIGSLMGFAAYFLPYFLLPFTFRFAGGALARIGGFVNSGHKGGFDRLRQGRQKNLALRGREFKAGSLYQDYGAGKLINNIGRRATVGYRGHYGLGRRGRAGLATADLANTEEALKNNPMLRELRNYDDGNAVLGLSGGTAAGGREAMRELFDMSTPEGKMKAENAYAAASAVGFRREYAAAALQTMAQNKSRSVKAGDVDVVQRGINRLAGDNTHQQSQMAWAYQAMSRDAGRGDLGGAWHTQEVSNNTDKLVTSMAGKGLTIDPNVARRHITTLDGMTRTEVPALMRGYPDQMKQYTETLDFMINNGDADQKNLAATRMLELQKNISYTSGGGQQIINDYLQHPVTDPATGNVTPFVDYASPVPIDEQLAVRAGSTVQPIALSRGARTYDQERDQSNRIAGSGPGAP